MVDALRQVVHRLRRAARERDDELAEREKVVLLSSSRQITRESATSSGEGSTPTARTNLMRRDSLPAVPRQAIQDARAVQPDAILARHQHPVDIHRPHREAAVVHALERRRDLHDVAPDDPLGEGRTAVPAAGRCSAGTPSSEGRARSPSERTRGARTCKGRGRVVMMVREGRRPGIRRQRRKWGQVRLVQRLRARVEIVHEDDRCGPVGA